jgi:hypothetical protein
MEGSFEALKILNDHFKGEAYLISKCSEWAEAQILTWLHAHDFFGKTGIDPKRVHFVRERNEKDGICRKLGITHFIDDRLEILGYMVESTPSLYLFMPDKKEVEEFKEFLTQVTVVDGWSQVIKKIIIS